MRLPVAGGAIEAERRLVRIRMTLDASLSQPHESSSSRRQRGNLGQTVATQAVELIMSVVEMKVLDVGVIVRRGIGNSGGDETRLGHERNGTGGVFAVTTVTRFCQFGFKAAMQRSGVDAMLVNVGVALAARISHRIICAAMTGDASLRSTQFGDARVAGVQGAG